MRDEILVHYDWNNIKEDASFKLALGFWNSSSTMSLQWNVRWTHTYTYSVKENKKKRKTWLVAKIICYIWPCDSSCIHLECYWCAGEDINICYGLSSSWAISLNQSLVQWLVTLSEHSSNQKLLAGHWPINMVLQVDVWKGMVEFEWLLRTASGR